MMFVQLYATALENRWNQEYIILEVETSKIMNSW